MRSIILLVILFSNITPQYFLDITDESGTEVSRQQSSFFGAGATMADFNQDGLEDIIVPTPDGDTFKLFKNNGNGTFLDVAQSIGFADENAESINILVADYDNDGHNDFFVVNWSETSRLYHNNGNNTFTDVTGLAGMDVLFASSRAACWLDYNRDGYIDLYMVNRESSEYNVLYHNNGDGTFSNRTDFAGVNGTEDKMGLVVIAFDYNNDLWPDIYIGNDVDTGNIFYHNNGDGTFTDFSVQSGLNLEFNTMGMTAEDYDNDGDLDIYMTNVDDPGNALMQNNGDGTFTDVAGTLGITVELIGWGVNFFDFDNDRDLDLYVANGCISGTGGNDGMLGCTWNSPQSNELEHGNILFSNNGNGTFNNISNNSGLNNSYLTTGTTIGDINNDGFYDIYEVNELDPSSSSNYCRLYKNNFGEINPGIRWVKIKLEGVASNRNAIGSRLYISQEGGTYQQIREIKSGESYSSQSSYTASFGLGSVPVIDTLKISWPSGLVQYHYDITPNQIHYIIEGQNSDESICLFPVDNYDCDGNCMVDTDCAGICGGDTVVDECGVCDGDGIDEGVCDCNGNIDCGCGCNQSCEDSDSDTILDCNDDCPNIYNPYQHDRDQDGLADACNDDDDDGDDLIDCWTYWYDDGVLLSDAEKYILIDLEECEDFALGINLVPSSIEVLNSFPNPFNPSTVI